MTTMTDCIIIEDEPLAQNILRTYIGDCPSLKLVGVYGDAIEAHPVVSAGTVQLIFLDINLPRLSGISFLRTLTRPPMIIFTTAYPEFAVEGFELDAVDYLLKPFSFERFLKSVNRALTTLATIPAGKGAVTSADKFIFLKSDKKVFKIDLDDILYLEGTGDYVKVITVKDQYMVNNTLKTLLNDLPAGRFLRVHKSYIISTGKLSFVEGNYIKMGNTDIPIGAAYREAFFNWLNETNN